MNRHEDRPRVEAPYFEGPSNMYTRMARVLEYTARQHCSRWAINVSAIVPEPISGSQREAKFVANSQKLDRWCQIITEAPTGSRILLLDVDTFFVNPIDDIWDHDFDLAYTVRSYILPFNGGVVFARATPRTKAFMNRWREQNAAMYADEHYHMQWKQKYGGINQASFGCVLDSDHGATLLKLPCVEWNCEDSCWHQFDPRLTRIVHVKSGLRRLIFEGRVWPRAEPYWTEERLTPLAERWLALEREATYADAEMSACAV